MNIEMSSKIGNIGDALPILLKISPVQNESPALKYSNRILERFSALFTSGKSSTIFKRYTNLYLALKLHPQLELMYLTNIFKNFSRLIYLHNNKPYTIELILCFKSPVQKNSLLDD